MIGGAFALLALAGGMAEARDDVDHEPVPDSRGGWKRRVWLATDEIVTVRGPTPEHVNTEADRIRHAARVRMDEREERAREARRLAVEAEAREGNERKARAEAKRARKAAKNSKERA